jgi:DNA repair protein RadA/Sms
MEGTRPLLVEIQALVCPTKMAYPIRKVTGIDYNRAIMIIAVLERHLGLKLSSADIYLNAAGGIRAAEPAVDLSLAFAMASAYKGKPLGSQMVVVGEVGLVGEVRSVNYLEARIKEVEKLGFKKVVVPKANLKEIARSEIELFGISSVKEISKVCFGE